VCCLHLGTLLLEATRQENMPQRGLVLLLCALALAFLAVDSVEFNGRYRKAVWHESIRQGQRLQYNAVRFVDMGWS
jgi:hypothetical protein